MEYYKDYWGPEDDAVKSGYEVAGDPVMEVYRDDFHGWNSLILCWAEKVREVFVNNGDGKIPEGVFITDIKEKYGTLRISFNYGSYFKPPYEKINDLIYMVEHLSKYCCYQCGHIGRSSNEKKPASSVVELVCPSSLFAFSPMRSATKYSFSSSSTAFSRVT